jgi:hypothetical protein
MIRCLALLLLASLALPASAQGQVRRCMDSNGRPLFTDHRCSDLGAVDRLPPPARSGNHLDRTERFYRGGCPRTLSALVGELGAAIQSGDVNRLSSIYHWAGTSNASARKTLDRLEAIVSRPLVDIAPVMPVEREPEPFLPASTRGDPVPATAQSGQPSWMPSWGVEYSDGQPGQPAADAGASSTAASPASLPAPPPPPSRPRPVGLRVEQTLANSATPSRTVFGLRRSFGCFWLSL